MLNRIAAQMTFHCSTGEALRCAPCLGQRMMLARLVPDTINPRFMLYSLMAPDLMDRVQDKPIGMTVQHLRVGGVETLVVPLPSLAQRNRIVAKVDELIALCYQLEVSVVEGEQMCSKRLEAVLYNALEPAPYSRTCMIRMTLLII